MNILEVSGSKSTKSVLAEAGEGDYQALQDALYSRYRRRFLTVRFTTVNYYLRQGTVLTTNGRPVAVVQPAGVVLVESTLDRDEMVEVIKRAIKWFVSLLIPPVPPRPDPINPEPEYDIYADTSYFGTESGDKYHQNHGGQEPAVFYATREQAEADGKFPCGVCLK